MIALHDFNHLPAHDAVALLHPCVAIPGWADALVRGRPYPSRKVLFITAQALTQTWDGAALTLALSAHSRIGEKPAGTGAEAGGGGPGGGGGAPTAATRLAARVAG